MREILFRGQRADNGEWVYGDFLHGNERKSLRDSIFVYDGETQSFNDFTIAPETLGQYTGLKDKNGTKIFEGDIVKDEAAQMLGKVVFATAADGFDEMTGFMVDDIFDVLQNYNGFWHFVEVIGNIHDNHELL